MGRVAGFRRIKPWRNRDDTILVRYYRVPWGTEPLPVTSSFMRTDWLPEVLKKAEDNPGEGAVEVGEFTGGGKYDKGGRPAGWRPPTHFIGTEEQWLLGSEFPKHQPLVWRGGFSTACRAPDKPEGQACATGCDQCPLVSPIWIADSFEDFAGFTQGVLVQTQGCEFSTKCVPGPGAPTAAAWEVVPEESFGGLTGGVIHSRGNLTWSGCC